MSVEARLAPAARPGKSLAPTSVPVSGGEGGVGPAAMNRVTRNGPTGAEPALRVVNDTVIGRPVPAAAGPATAVIFRSPKSPISSGEDAVLFVVSLSGTVPGALARAMRNRLPVTADAGMISVGAAAKL